MTLPVPTYRLLGGAKRELYAPTRQEREDAWGDEVDRLEREDREKEKGE